MEVLPALRQGSLSLAQRQIQPQPTTPRQQGQRTPHPGLHGVGPACRIVGAPATRQKASASGHRLNPPLNPPFPNKSPQPPQQAAAGPTKAERMRKRDGPSGRKANTRASGTGPQAAKRSHAQAGRVLGPQSGLGFAEVPPAPEDPSRSIHLRHPKTRPVQSASSRLRIRAPRRPRPQGAAPAADRPALNNVSEGGARAE